jgi:branched-chain amino acid transport system permease protein
MGFLRRLLAGTGRRHLLIALIGLVVVLFVLSAVSPYRQGQLATMAYYGIAVGGLTVLTGLNGQISLGHGALMAVGAYTTALMLHTRSSMPPVLLVLLASVLVTLVVGAVVGAAAARLHGPYLAGATLAMAVAVPGIATYFGGTLGGEQGLSVITPEPPAWFDNLVFFLTAKDVTPDGYVAYLGWIGLIVTYLLLANLAGSRVGRRWRAVRDGEVAAELAGIHLGRARVSAFVVSAACAGLAGSVLAMVVRLTAPSAFSLTLSLGLLTAIVLGGLGSLAGALIGAALLTFLPSLVSGWGQNLGLSSLQSAQLAPFLYGLTLVLVILLAPAGLVGEVSRRRRRRPSPPPPGSTTPTNRLDRQTEGRPGRRSATPSDQSPRHPQPEAAQ